MPEYKDLQEKHTGQIASDPEYNNLLKKHTSGEEFPSYISPYQGDSKYDVGLTADFPQEEYRAQRQSSAAKLGSGAVNAVTQTVSDILASPGYLYQGIDILVNGENADYQNAWIDGIKGVSDKLKLDIYRTKASEGFSPTSAGWWADLMPSFASSLALLFPARGATWLLGNIAKEMGGLKALSAINKGLKLEKSAIGIEQVGTLRNLTTAGISRIMESTMESAQTYEQVAQSLQGQLNPQTGQPYSEQEIAQFAGKAASENYIKNLPLVVLDMGELSMLAKGWKGVKAAQKELKDATTKGISSALGATGKTMGMESIEEQLQFIFSAESVYKQQLAAGKVKESEFGDRLGEYLKDPEYWTAAFAGAIGGGIFQVVGSTMERKRALSQEKQKNLNIASKELHQAFIAGDKQKVDKVSDFNFHKAVGDHLKNGDYTSFRDSMQKLADTEKEVITSEEGELNKDFYTKLNQRIKDADFAEEQFYRISNELETPNELKSIKFSTILDQRLTQQRINSTTAELNRLYTEDVATGGLSPNLVELKKLKIAQEAEVADPRLAAHAKAPFLPGKEIVGTKLQKEIDKLRKDIIVSDPRFEDMEITEAEQLIDKEISTANDNELIRLTKSLLHDKVDFNESRETLNKLSNKSEQSKLIKEVEARKIKASEEAKVKETADKKAKIEAIKAQTYATNFTSAQVDALIETEKAKQTPDPDIMSELTKIRESKIKEEAKTALAGKKGGKVLTKEELEVKKANDYVTELAETLSARFPQYDLSEMSESLVEGKLAAIDRNGKQITMEDYIEIQKIASEIQEKFYPKEQASDSQTVISETLSGSYPTEQEQITDELEVSTSDEKTVGKQSGVVMMSLFKHYKKKVGAKLKFFWGRIEGIIQRDNVSNLNEKAIKDLKVGDKVTFELRTLSEKEKEANDRLINAIPENAKVLTEGYHESIAILDASNQLIGFVQLPHEVKIDTRYENAADYKAKVAARDKVIAERLHILSKLKAGEKVEGKIKKKGTGKLLTRLTKEGKIDLNAENGYNTVFNEILPREQDQIKIGNQSISLFVYSDGDKLTFGQFAPMGLRKDQIEKINSRLKELGKWAPKGYVFQLVKAQNDEWYPIPIYSTKVNQVVADKVLAEISKLTDSTEVKEVTARLNKYIFTTWEDKPGSLKVESIKDKAGKSILRFTIAGNEYTLEELRRKEDLFSADLLTLKQNIDFKNINTISGQNELKENRTLTTNAYTRGEEYLAQPYIETSPLISETKKEAITPLDVKAKKADIERRRQEELNKVTDVDKNIPFAKTLEQTGTTAHNKEEQDKLAGNLPQEFESVTPDGKKTNKLKLTKVTPFSGNWRITYTDENGNDTHIPIDHDSQIVGKNRTQIQAEVIKGYVANSGYGRGLSIITEEKATSQILDKVFTPTDKEIDEQLRRKKEINAKYDAELAALEKAPAKTEEESMKTLSSEDVTRISGKKVDLNEETDLNLDPEEPAYKRSKKLDVYEKEDRAKVKKFLDQNLPGLTLSDVEDLTKLKGTLEDAFGLYRNGVIHISKYAPKGTGYHEAGHGVFRSMLTQDEKFDLIDEAIIKYTAPTKQDLDFLQQQFKQKFSEEALTYYWYEEKIMDDFAEYQNAEDKKPFIKKLGQKITNFFNKILKFFGLFTQHDQSKIDKLFKDISSGKFKTKSIQAKKTYTITRRDISNLESLYAASPIPGFSSQNKAHFVRAIKGRVIEKVQSIYSQGKFSGVKALNVNDVINEAFAEIKASYLSKAENGESLGLNEKEVAGALKVSMKFEEFKREVVAELKQHGVIKNDKLILTESTADTEETEVNELNTESNDTKGEKFGDKSSIPGLKKASQRLKLFFSAIPAVNEKGEIKKDIYGDIIYVDFDKLYYYIERNLLGLYTWEEQLNQLRSLAQTRPEVQSVISRLLEPSVIVNEDYQKNLVSDFKTNFSKQQKAAIMVSFERTGTGLAYKIFEANRQNLGTEIYGNWESNLSNPEKNTISVFKEGKKTTYGTEKAKQIEKDWKELSEKHEEELPEKVLNKILLTAGIEYSPEVIHKIAKNPSDLFRSSLTEVLEWFASETPETKQIKGRKAMYELVNMEVANMLTRFTSSYNNAEGEIVNTIQLPSYASKLISDLTASEDRTHKFTNILEGFRQEEAYKYNNILNLLEKENSFRTNTFTIGDLSGLSQSKLDSKGAVFSKMTPKDFMNVSIALFQNTFVNKGEAKMKLPTAYYIYLTPADKKQQMVSTGLQYLVKHSNGKVDPTSEIVDKFYNIVLAEASRIKNALKFKEQVKASQGEEKEQLMRNLNEFYHYKGKDNLAFNGLAYEFNYFDKLNDNLDEITEELSQNLLKDTREIMSKFEENIKIKIAESLNEEVQTVLSEAVTKEVISEQNGVYSNISLEKATLGENVHDSIIDLITSFSLNQLLHNIDLSHIMNGDIAQYKANQIQKRTYQSGAQTTNGNFEKDTIKIKPVKDLTIKVSPHYDVYADFLKEQGYTKDQVAQRLSKMKSINSTDSQMWGSPKFFKRLMQEEGRWTPDIEVAYKIAEGEITGTPEQIERSIQVIAAIKPFMFGRRFNPNTNIWEYYQIKTNIAWLFQNFVKNNPFLSEQKDNMTATGTELIAHESTFKAMMPTRDALEDLTKESYSDINTFTIRREDFGIQTENPVKGLDTENDGLRQIKMIMLGMIDTNLEYNGISGQEIRDTINTLEGLNVKEGSIEFLKALKDKESNEFKEFLKEELLTRNPPSNVAKALEIVDGEFVGALNFGPVAGAAQNMLSSILEKRVVKQAFAGGNFVQVSSLGVKGGTLKALSEEEIKKHPELEKLQSTLKHIIPHKEGQTELAEVILPAHAKEFFNEDMSLKDITKIPEELRTFITYRIPVEGPHSILTVKVVGFLSPEQGNYILMPNEVVAQWGSDFDFDKAFFVRKHLYQNKQGLLKEVKYIKNKDEAYRKFILGQLGKNYDKLSDEYKAKFENIEEDIKDFQDVLNRLKTKVNSQEKFRLFRQYLEELDLSKFSKFKLAEEALKNIGVLRNIEEYTVEELNNKEARNNRILDMYLNILRSPHTFPHIITGSGFDKLIEIRDRLFGKKPKANFFSGTTQRDLKYRNALSSKLRALAALHETGHTARTVMNSYVEVLTQAGTPDTKYNFNFNDVKTNRLDGLYTSEKNLIIKELGIALAATVDDIKDPILEELNINDHTLHTLASIVASGYEYETGVNLITQPAIRALTNKLSESYTLTKEIGQKRVNVDSFIKDYTNMYDQVAKKLAAPPDFGLLTETHGLKDTDMIKWREFAENPENLKISILEDYNDVSAHDIVDKHNLELARYLGFQIKVLNRFSVYNEIGQGLKDLNLYLQINNSLSGKFEDLLQKEYLRDKILSPDFPIKGIDFTKLHTIHYAQEAVSEFLNEMEGDFPFQTFLYGDIKVEYVNIQKKTGAENKDLTRIKPEDRGKINSFISAHLLLRHPFLTKLSSEDERKRILVELPKLMSEILNPSNAKYASLRRNEFIQNLKVDYKVEHGKYGQILSRAVKMEPIAQDVLSEQFFTLYNSTAELKEGYTFKQFAEDLIKFSYLSSGLYLGKQSYHNLIPFESNDELGFNSFVKEINSKLKKDKLFISSEGKEIVLDQLIRNFPKFFTNVYDIKMFSPMTKEKIPAKISTHEAKVISNNRSDFFIGTDIEGKVFPAYIRVFNPDAGKALLYKQGVRGIYNLITTLGIPGKFIEMSINHIEKSIIPRNAPDFNPNIRRDLSVTDEMFGNGYELDEYSGEDVLGANDVEMDEDLIGISEVAKFMGFGEEKRTWTQKEINPEDKTACDGGLAL